MVLRLSTCRLRQIGHPWTRTVSSFVDGGGMFKLGSRFSVQRAFSPADVATFTELTGDTNPIHSDDAVARQHNFPAAIVQGMLCASLFPAMIGSRLPGAVYMTQTLKFHAPICVGELVQAEMEVSQRSGRRVVFNTTCKRMSDGKLAIDGTALMLFPKGEKGLQ